MCPCCASSTARQGIYCLRSLPPVTSFLITCINASSLYLLPRELISLVLIYHRLLRHLWPSFLFRASSPTSFFFPAELHAAQRSLIYCFTCFLLDATPQPLTPVPLCGADVHLVAQITVSGCKYPPRESTVVELGNGHIMCGSNHPKDSIDMPRPQGPSVNHPCFG